ncbi:hypothetical protein LRS13_18125 [Svornostia abyssi]|uniref:CARDB domain-containing protein n=1 Tax=Svornostia abyssi TaxID=2898438 RepID=A0ABY5PD44_9ACTN|nr:hypothetical protein LRS13_18125 [Parviterribacteraceae bacterium J379]
MHRAAFGTWLFTVAALCAPAASSAARVPDLTVARVSVSALTVDTARCTTAGCPVRLDAAARIVNRGGRRSARTRAGFFLSADARRDRADRAAGRVWLQAVRSRRNRSAEATLSLTDIQPGTHRLIACADVTNRVHERREGNNCRASAPFTVQGAATAPASGGPQPPTAPCQEPGWRTDLCAEIAAAMASRSFLDMADVVTFALLYQHHRTGQAIPRSIAAGLIQPLRTAWDPVRGQAGLATYRVAGYLDFWAYSAYAGVDWPRFPDRMDTRQEFTSWWETYGIVQFTARQNAINHSLNAILQSEAAWREAMDDWKAYDLKLITAQQHSDATVFADLTLGTAQAAVLNAANAVKGPP